MNYRNTKKKDSTMLVSVIVPVYKTEKYLRKCVDSILAQTYSNLEILLIDDGSPDHCGEICDDYAERDKRVRVIHNDNHGVSYSRNCGIKASTGEYLLFIDSDDRINPIYVEEMVEHLQKYDFVISGFLIFWVEKRQYEKRKIWNPTEGMTHSVSKDFRYLFTPIYSVCGKLYRANIIKKENILFDETISGGEDGLFNFEYLKYIDSYSVANKAKYIYSVYPEYSLSKQYYLDDDLQLIEKSVTSFESLLEEVNPLEKGKFLWLYCRRYLEYTGSGYKKYRRRILFIKSLLREEWQTEGIKHWLLALCIRVKLIWPIYLYYFRKNRHLYYRRK